MITNENSKLEEMKKKFLFLDDSMIENSIHMTTKNK